MGGADLRALETVTAARGEPMVRPTHSLQRGANAGPPSEGERDYERFHHGSNDDAASEHHASSTTERASAAVSHRAAVDDRGHGRTDRASARELRVRGNVHLDGWVEQLDQHRELDMRARSDRR